MRVNGRYRFTMKGERNHYSQIRRESGLKRHRPETLLIDQENNVYLSVEEMSEIVGLSPSRIRGLIAEDRIQAIKPAGHQLFVSVASTLEYLGEGRKPPGRPRKGSFPT